MRFVRTTVFEIRMSESIIKKNLHLNSNTHALDNQTNQTSEDNLQIVLIDFKLYDLVDIID